MVFGINNNSHLNQHGRLVAAATRLGRPAAALYALPLLTKTQEVRRFAGRVLDFTCFVTALSIGQQAQPAIIDGQKRKVAVSWFDPKLLEVRSEPCILDQTDPEPRLIGEIAAVRLQREMTSWRATYAEFATGRARQRRHGRILSLRFIRFLAYWARVPEELLLELYGVSRSGASAEIAGSSDEALDENTMQDGLDLEAPSSRSPDDTASYQLGLLPVVSPEKLVARATGIVKHTKDLVRSLWLGSWINAVPELPPMEDLVEVEDWDKTSSALAAEEALVSANLVFLVI